MSNFKKRRIRSQRPSFASGMLINLYSIFYKMQFLILWILIEFKKILTAPYSVSSSISSRLSYTLSEVSTPSSAVRISRFPTRRQSTPNIGHLPHHHSHHLQIKRRSYPRRYSRSEIFLASEILIFILFNSFLLPLTKL